MNEQQSFDVIIVGGGIIGSAIAYYLTGKGIRPLILEKERLGCQASSAAAGMLAAQAEMKEAGALYEWARTSRAMFPDLAETLREVSGIDIGFIHKGMLKVAKNDEEARELQSVLSFQQQSGETVTWLDPAELLHLESKLSAQLAGALWIPGDGQVSAPDLSAAFAHAALNQGASVEEYAEVLSLIVQSGKIIGVETARGRRLAEHVVVTSGAWTGRLLQPLGVNLPVFPVKGEMFSVLSPTPLVQKTIFNEHCYLVPKRGGRLLVGATMIEGEQSRTVSFGGIQALMERAKALLPAIADTEWERAWSGLRPQTADGLPILGQHPNLPGVWIAAGHFRNGILLSPVTGKWIAESISGEKSDAHQLDASTFRPDRFH